jgi:hypothetical protein
MAPVQAYGSESGESRKRQGPRAFEMGEDNNTSFWAGRELGQSVLFVNMAEGDWACRQISPELAVLPWIRGARSWLQIIQMPLFWEGAWTNTLRRLHGDEDVIIVCSVQVNKDCAMSYSARSRMYP